MEKFKSTLKNRLALIITFNGLTVIFILLTAIYSNMTAAGSEALTDMIRGFQTGIFIGLQFAMLTLIVKYAKALKNDEVLKNLYIQEKDERKKLIQDKIGGVGFNFTIGTAAAATVTAGFLNQLVFVTLLGVLVFMVFVKAFLKLYYKNKF
ncbi:MAG: rane protein [Clostridia bacterium]|jgi:hypothetical protein|nr:rane protein [Clostridia bacterium]